MMHLDHTPARYPHVAMSPRLPRVLIVDDDRLYARRAALVLADIAELRVVEGRCAAMRVVGTWLPDIVILDMFLTDGDALYLPDELRALATDHALGIIYLSKGPGAATRFQSLDGGFLGMVDRDSGSSGLRQAIS